MSENKLQIVYLTNGYPTPDNPSHGIFNRRAAIAISKLVHLTVIHYRLYKPGRRFYEKIQEDGFERIILCVPFSPVYAGKLHYFNNRIFYYFSLYYLKPILRKAQVVHASDGNLGVLAAWLKPKFSFKVLTQFIGGDLNQDMPQYIGKTWMKGWKNKLDAVAFNSCSLKVRFEELFGPHKTAKIIYRGVDTQRFTPSDKPQSNPTFYFLGGLPGYATFEHGRNTKGGINLMEAWERLESEKSMQAARLTFAGPDADIDIAKAWLKKLKAPERVTLLGKINPENIPEFHRNGTIALIPSLEEGLPNAAMEAAATGNLVIANPVGGVPEIVEHAETGLLCVTNDVKGLVEQMQWAVEHPQEVNRIKLNALKKMREEFSSIEFGKNYADFYREILNQSSVKQ